MKLDVTVSITVDDETTFDMLGEIRAVVARAAGVYADVESVDDVVATLHLPKRGEPASLSSLVDLSLVLNRAAKAVRVSPLVAKRFIDALVAMPSEAAERIVAERRHEHTRRLRAQVRRQADRNPASERSNEG